MDPGGEVESHRVVRSEPPRSCSHGRSHTRASTLKAEQRVSPESWRAAFTLRNDPDPTPTHTLASRARRELEGHRRPGARFPGIAADVGHGIRDFAVDWPGPL